MKKVIVLLGLASFILASCTFSRVTRYFSAPDYVNPHNECQTCHGTAKPKGAKARFSPGIDPSQFCLECHKYAANHHPVNFVPEQHFNPQFPLFQGRVTCLSCHEIHGGPEQKGTARLLRGGPYQDRRQICFTCHTQEQYAGINPHDMLDDAGNHRVLNGRPICLTCHELEPDPYVDEANTVLFKADVAFLCWRCHPLKHGFNLDRHLLAVPDQEMRKTMASADVRRNYIMPLTPRDRITCSTCHNPHEYGVFPAGPASAGADEPMRLRDDHLCVGCHNI